MVSKYCPICYNSLNVDVSIRQGMVLEEHRKCNNCGYEYDYTYGSERYKVDDEVFCWSDGNDPNFDKQMSLELAITKARKKYN